MLKSLCLLFSTITTTATEGNNMHSKCVVVSFSCTEAKGQESHAEDEVANENETKSAGGEVGGQQEVGGNRSSSPPREAPPPFTDVLRTPRLSDFGLSEMELTRALAVPDLSSDVLKVEGIFMSSLKKMLCSAQMSLEYNQY